MRRLEPSIGRLLSALLSILLSAALVACQGLGGGATLVEGLDQATGVTFRTEPQAVVYASTESQYSRSGRDYLYLGPVQINRQGRYEYLLWVGAATTLDRGYLAPAPVLPVRIFVDLPDDLMVLELKAWRERMPNAGRAPYAPRVALIDALGASVTRSQLAVLNEAAPETIRAIDAEGRARIYERWPNAKAALWPVFIAATRTTP
jgi:hypothetical protein